MPKFPFPTPNNGTVCSASPDFDDYDYFDAISWIEEAQDGDEDPITEKSPLHPLAKRVQYPNGSWGMRCTECMNDFPDANGNQPNGTFKCSGCLMWEEQKED